MIGLNNIVPMMGKIANAESGGGGDTMTPLTLTALANNSKVTLNKVGSPPDVSLEYSTGGAWTTYTIGTEITLASAGNYIKFRGDNDTFSTSYNKYYQFSMSGTIEASGNVMSLLDSTLASTTIPCNYCFRSLFQNCSSLTAAPTLPAMTLMADCYSVMFYGCTNLTAAPTLPAMTLAADCYRFMFYGCSKLSSIEVSFTSWGAQTQSWVSSVASSGTFTKPSSLAETYGASNIPTDWTVINK